MSLKKTDMVKHLAKKLDGQRKAAGVPPRFGPGSAPAVVANGPDKPADKPKLVSVTCRLPADLAARLREHAVRHEGGVHGVVAQAVEQWLAASSAA